MIVLVPEGGLANRMRSINSFYQIARKTKHKLIVVWEQELDFSSNYKILFKMPRDILAFYVPQFGTEQNKKKWGHWKHIESYIMKYASIRWNSEETRIIRVENTVDMIEKTIRSKKLIYVRGCEEIVATERNQIFVPVTEPMKRVAELQKCFPAEAPIIGLHIRRTDNVFSKSNSPTELFCQAIESEIDKKPTVCFFLATDDSTEEQYLVNRYQGRIITNSKAEKSRETDNGQIDAFVDMLLLASTQKIYGSFWSSFGQEAAKIGGNVLEILSLNNAPDIDKAALYSKYN